MRQQVSDPYLPAAISEASLEPGSVTGASRKWTCLTGRTSATSSAEQLPDDLTLPEQDRFEIHLIDRPLLVRVRLAVTLPWS